MAADHHAAGDPGADPDSAEKPSSPAQITKPSWRYILRRTVHEFRRDECTDSAAVMTFFAVLSVFPGLLTVVSMLGVVGQAQVAHHGQALGSECFGQFDHVHLLDGQSGLGQHRLGQDAQGGDGKKGCLHGCLSFHVSRAHDGIVTRRARPR